MSYVDGSAVNITVLFQKVQTCHMLTAQPSKYDMFGLIELYGRKLQSVIDQMLVWHVASYTVKPVYCNFPRMSTLCGIQEVYDKSRISYWYEIDILDFKLLQCSDPHFNPLKSLITLQCGQ